MRVGRAAPAAFRPRARGVRSGIGAHARGAGSKEGRRGKIRALGFRADAALRCMRGRAGVAAKRTTAADSPVASGGAAGCHARGGVPAARGGTGFLAGAFTGCRRAYRAGSEGHAAEEPGRRAGHDRTPHLVVRCHATSQSPRASLKTELIRTGAATGAFTASRRFTPSAHRSRRCTDHGSCAAVARLTSDDTVFSSYPTGPRASGRTRSTAHSTDRSRSA